LAEVYHIDTVRLKKRIEKRIKTRFAAKFVPGEE
jgi:hypothetical protein